MSLMSASALRLKKKAADLEQKKQFDKALALYIQLLEESGSELDNSDLGLYNRVGDLLLRQGNVSEALTYFEKAVDIYAERGFLNNAIALCNRILRQAPARTGVYYKLGRISASKGFKSDAKKNFLEYADRMQKAGQIDEAFRALKEFADLCPDQDDVRLMLADWLARENRTSEAVAQLETLYNKLDAEGRSAEAHATLGRIKAIDPAANPRPSGTWAAVKANDLVFLDLDDFASPLRRQDGSATPSSSPTPAPLGREAQLSPSVVPALEGLRLTFLPGQDGDDAPAPSAAPGKREGDDGPPDGGRTGDDSEAEIDLDMVLSTPLRESGVFAAVEDLEIDLLALPPVGQELPSGATSPRLDAIPDGAEPPTGMPAGDSRRATSGFVAIDDIAHLTDELLVIEPEMTGDAGSETVADWAHASERGGDSKDRGFERRNVTGLDGEWLRPAGDVDGSGTDAQDRLPSELRTSPPPLPSDALALDLGAVREAWSFMRGDVADPGTPSSVAAIDDDIGAIDWQGADAIAPDSGALASTPPVGGEDDDADQGRTADDRMYSPETPDGAKPEGVSHEHVTPDEARDQGAADDGAPYDGAPYDGAPYDGAPYDGAPYDGARHDAARSHGAVGDDQTHAGDASVPHGHARDSHARDTHARDPYAGDMFHHPERTRDGRASAEADGATPARLAHENAASESTAHENTESESAQPECAQPHSAQPHSAEHESPDLDLAARDGLTTHALRLDGVSSGRSPSESSSPWTAGPSSEREATPAASTSEESGEETPDAWVEAALGAGDDRSLDHLLTPLGVDAIRATPRDPSTRADETDLVGAMVPPFMREEAERTSVGEGTHQPERADSDRARSDTRHALHSDARDDDEVDADAIHDRAVTGRDQDDEAEIEAAFREADVLLPLLDVSAEGDGAEGISYDSFEVSLPSEADPLFASPPSFGELDSEGDRFSPEPLLTPEATETGEWGDDGSPEVLIDGEWRDEHVGAFLSGEGPAVSTTSAHGPSATPPRRFDDLSAAMLWPAPDSGDWSPDPSAAASAQRGTLSFGGSEAQLRRRLELNPWNWGLHRQLGEELLGLGKLEDGLAELEAAITGYEQAGDLEEARRVVDVVIRVDPRSVRHHQKRVEYAVRSSDRPRLVEAYVELADALFREGETDKALVVYSRVLELSPGNARAQSALGLLGPVSDGTRPGSTGGEHAPAENTPHLGASNAADVIDPEAAASCSSEPTIASPDGREMPARPEHLDGAEGPGAQRVEGWPRVSLPATYTAEMPALDDLTIPRTQPAASDYLHDQQLPGTESHLHGGLGRGESPEGAQLPTTPAGAAHAGGGGHTHPGDGAEHAGHETPPLSVAAGPTPAPVIGTPAQESSVVPTALDPGSRGPASSPSRNDDDDDFIDLGEWLRATEPQRSTRMVTTEVAPTGDEQADFEHMLRRFKQGVAENVDEEDYESHYDLGVAFKEMGLVDEAISEFQKALRGDAHRVRSYEALGQCFVEKGQMQVAATLLTRAVETTRADDQQLVGVLYLLGYAHESMERRGDALGYYQRVFAVDIEFRDVAQRVALLERFPP